MQKTRIDKWLWAVRAFKTRSLATKACDTGKVWVEGVKVKPSYQVTEGKEVRFVKLKMSFQYKVLRVIDVRVGAPIAQECYEDQTTEEMVAENQRIAAIGRRGIQSRDKGLGRPTKKDRRDWDEFIAD